MSTFLGSLHILDLSLNHDPVNLITAVNDMEIDQQKGYKLGYLLYLTIPYWTAEQQGWGPTYP